MNRIRKIIWFCTFIAALVLATNVMGASTVDKSSNNLGLKVSASEMHLLSSPPDSVHYFFNKKGKLRLTIQIPEQRQSDRVWTSTYILGVASIASIGILYSMPEDVTNWDKSTMTLNTITSKWYRNVTTVPVIDKDGWFLNYVMHPYFGGVYYMGLRGAGYPWYQSALYSVGMSTFFWEYGFESLAEVPSAQDIVVTPVAGSLLGEGMYMAKKKIKENDEYLLGSRAIGQFTMFLLDPLNQVQDWVRMRGHRRQFLNGTEMNSQVMVLSGGGAGLNLYLTF